MPGNDANEVRALHPTGNSGPASLQKLGMTSCGVYLVIVRYFEHALVMVTL